MSEEKHYTWEEKIDSLAKLAKAVGRYIYAKVGRNPPSEQIGYYNDACQELFDAYYEFCKWRHEEPYVVDEIKGLLAQQSEVTGAAREQIGKVLHEAYAQDYEGWPTWDELPPAIQERCYSTAEGIVRAFLALPIDDRERLAQP